MTESDDVGSARPRWRIGVGAAVVVLLVAIGCAVVASALAPRGESTIVEPPASSTAADAIDIPEPAVSSASIFVHILGEVKGGGLFEFHTGDRAVDAVAAAGGFTKKADRASVNLARILVDGEQIVVPRRGKPGATGPGGSPPGSSAGGEVTAPGSPVNLNTADATALETLPGIGEALSARILAWRDQNGRFTTVDDLGSVTGIGEKTLDALRELVTV